MSDRGVSSPIGVILLIGMTVAVVTAVVVVGGAAIDDTRANAERSQMENAMSQFSSKASLVSLGESGSQQFNLGRVSEGDVSVKENAGNVSMYIDYQDGDREYITNVSMGAIVYRNGNTEIAYQGGGVWKRSNGRSTMVSPPEYHYQIKTLTFPIINVSGEGSTSGQVDGIIRTKTNSTQLYPDSDRDFNNPLENGTVYVEIQSEYCSGWESFFKERSQGGLEQECDTQPTDKVVMDLTVPFDPAFKYAVTSRNPIEQAGGNSGRGGGGRGGGGPSIESSEDGIIAPSADDKIQSQINRCVSDSDECFSIPSDGELTAGTYYTETDPGALDIDTNSGDVDVIINTNGDIDYESVTVLDEKNNVSFYMKTGDGSDINLNNQDINTDGNATKFITYVHSNTDAIKLVGNSRYTGGLYAPRSKIQSSKGNGCGGSPHLGIDGAIVVEEFCFKNGDFNHVRAMEDIGINIGESTIKYLHVSRNTIEVELS